MTRPNEALLSHLDRITHRVKIDAISINVIPTVKYADVILCGGSLGSWIDEEQNKL